MPEESSPSSEHSADYEKAVLFAMHLPILFEGRCIRSGNVSDDDLISGLSGPLVPKRFVEDVDAICYMPFASLIDASTRLRPAKPSKVYSEPLDTRKQRPPRDITRHRISSPLNTYGMVSIHACLQCIAIHILGAGNCLDFVLHRKSPWGEDLPVLIWLHGRWNVFSDARETLGLHDGASVAHARAVTLVVAQCRLGMFRFLIVGEGSQKTASHQLSECGFEDQRALMIWLQDSAAGLDVSKESAILFGRGIGG